MSTILQDVQSMIDDLGIDRFEYCINFGEAAQRKLEERLGASGYPIVRLITTDPRHYLFLVSDLVLEVEITSHGYINEAAEVCCREAIGVSLYGIDRHDDCMPYLLGDILEFSIERIALRLRDLRSVVFDSDLVLRWMYQRDVLVA